MNIWQSNKKNLISLGLMALPLLVSANCGTTTTPPTKYTLQITKDGTGTGTVSSNNNSINCGNTCTTNLDNGSSITLTATAEAGSSFNGWSNDCSGTSTCELSMSATRLVKATFTQNTPNPGGNSFTIIPAYQNNAFFIAQGANGLFELQIANRSNFSTPANQFDALTATGSIVGSGAGKLQLEYRKDLSSTDTLAFVLVASSSLGVGEYTILLEASAGAVKANVNARVQVTPCAFGCN